MVLVNQETEDKEVISKANTDASDVFNEKLKTVLPATLAIMQHTRRNSHLSQHIRKKSLLGPLGQALVSQANEAIGKEAIASAQEQGPGLTANVAEKACDSVPQRHSIPQRRHSRLHRSMLGAGGDAVKDTVKPCGSMISGKEFVCWYISYKNDQGYNTGLHYKQKTPEDDSYFEIDYRKVGKEHEKDREVKIFPIELKEDALNFYRSFLSKVIC